MKKAIIKKPIGKNIRLSDNGFRLIKTFCDERGYKIGAFIEIAALKKIATETIDKL